MEISDVRIRLVKESTDRLKAVCSVTLEDEFVVRDVKIVEGTNGLFVAMPSRKLSAPCPNCRTQNNVRAKYCNECGKRLSAPHIPADADGREKAHRDVAHPITPAFRQAIQDRVLEVYRLECERAGHPDLESSPETEERPSEYDDLIAGLRPGKEGEPSRGAGPRDSSSRDRRGGRRRRRPEHEARPAEVSERQEPAEAPAVATSDDDSGDEEEEETYMAAASVEPASVTPTDTETEPVVEEPRRDEGDEKPPDSDESRDDATPFGAGIL